MIGAAGTIGSIGNTSNSSSLCSIGRTVVNITPPTPKMLSVGQVYVLQLKFTSMLLVFCDSALSASALGILRTQ